MSAIGDYIRLTTEDCIGYNGYAQQKNWREQRLQQLQTIKSSTLTSITEAVEGITTPKTEKQKIFAKQVQNMIQNKWVKDFEDIDWQNLTVFTGDDVKNGGVGRIRLKNNQVTTKISTVVRKIEKLQQIILNDLKTKNTSLTTEQLTALFDKKIKPMMEAFEEAYNYSYTELKKFSDDKIDNLGLKVSQHRNRQIAIKTFMQETNALIEKYAEIPAIASAEGNLLEYVVAAAGQVTGSMAEQTIIKQIEDAVKGQQTVKTEFNRNILPAEIQEQVIQQNSKLNISSDTQSRRSKIDIQLEWDKEPLRISAKNIRIKDTHGWASLVDGSPLLTMIQNMDIDFVNHYLKLISYNKIPTELKDIRENTIEQMKLNLAFTALIGDQFSNSKDKVNVFVINDKNGKGIKFIAIPDLVKKLKSTNTSVKLNTKSISDFRLLTKKMNLQQIIMKIHETKVHAAFNAAILY